MELLVSKFSHGKYQNEGELFAEPVSPQNVQLMGEMIALQAFRNVKKFEFDVTDKLYIDLIKDLHHMQEVGYVTSDSYDYAQTAICFLCQFMGRSVYEIYGKDSKGIQITIKSACFREVDGQIRKCRRRATKVDSIDFTDYKALPVDPVNCFEKEQTDYDKADEILNALHLNELQAAILNCYLRGMIQSEVMAELNIGRGCINYRKAQIRKKYIACFGSY